MASEACPGREGWGECAPLPQLSVDDLPDYEGVLRGICAEVARTGQVDTERWREYPSMLFGLETALRHLERGTYALWDTPFSRGEEGICINGLIWMGDHDAMYRQIREKLEAGFRCVKLKIGAIGLEEELDLLRFIRRHFPAREVELRVDANGAFAPAEALDKLKRLAELDLHSIEQPIRAGQWDEMAGLTSVSPLPVAFDEELIGHCSLEAKRRLLDALHPQYIVLKPSLHGGFSGCREWIEEAEKRNVGWWITSALESNVGLNAIAQWCATWHTSDAAGIGHGDVVHRQRADAVGDPERLFVVCGRRRLNGSMSAWRGGVSRRQTCTNWPRCPLKRKMRLCGPFMPFWRNGSRLRLRWKCRLPAPPVFPSG